MKGDFSRSFKPDHARNERYRRVLLQQGRLVLDSDVNAGVDAMDRNVRDLAEAVVGPAGSSDGGFLVTPGPLFAHFDTLDSVSRGEGSHVNFRFHRGHDVRLFGRFPSLHLDASNGNGSVVIRGRRPFVLVVGDKLRFIAQMGLSGTTFSVKIGTATYTPTPVGSYLGSPFAIWEITLTANTTVESVQVFLATDQLWIAQIEGEQIAGAQRRFWCTRGRYYVNGLTVELSQDVAFPEGMFPWAGETRPAVPVPTGITAHTPIVAYLEAREQLVTVVEAPGIHERALGGSSDTTVRTRAVGLVKLAAVTGTSSDHHRAVLRAFAHRIGRGGRLRVTTPETPAATDPCALPLSGGYTGPEHRLYRFEVHRGGDLGASGALLKWSRNNGSELSEVAALTAGVSNPQVTLARDLPLADGDVLELLSDREELWDDAVATVNLTTDGAETFRPAPRAQGLLFVVRATAAPREFLLLDPASLAPATLPSAWATYPGRKARRWDGILNSAPTTDGGDPVTSFNLGDGISLSLSGSGFEAGDYWEYEARVSGDNAGLSWDAPQPPHGPERHFVPLATLDYPGIDGMPLSLRGWHDGRYRALHALEADMLRYDGEAAGVTHTNVQQAIDHLFLHPAGACCDAELSPLVDLSGMPVGDDAVRITNRINEALPDGGVLCLRSGIYRLQSNIPISGKNVEIRGCPGAVILCEGSAPSLTVGTNATVTLRDVTLRRTTGDAPFVRLASVPSPSLTARPPALHLRNATLLHLSTAPNACAIQSENLTAPTLDSVAMATADFSTETAADNQALLHIEDSIIVAPIGLLLHQIIKAKVLRSACVFRRFGLCARYILLAELDTIHFAGSYSEDLRTAILDVPLARLPHDVVPMIPTGNSVDAGGVCLVAHEVTFLSVRDTFFFTQNGCGVWCDTLQDSTFDGNYQTGEICVRARIAERVSFDRERIIAERFGVYFGEQASAVSLRQCDIDAPTGVLFAATLAQAEVSGAIVRDLWVAENRFIFHPPSTPTTTLKAGIQIGAAASGAAISDVLPQVVSPANGTETSKLSHSGLLTTPQTGDIGQVELRGNSFLYDGSGYGFDVGILCTLVQANDPPSPDHQHTGRIDGNNLRAGMVGVIVRGPGWRVAHNTIVRHTTAAPTGSSPFAFYAGIVLWGSGRALGAANGDGLSEVSSVLQNTIDLVVRTTPAATELPHAIGVAVRGEGGTSLVRIQGNSIQCHRAIVSLQDSNLQIIDNVAGSGFVLVKNCRALTVQGNRFGADTKAEFILCRSPRILDNSFHALYVLDLSVSAQVMNNRVAAKIYVIPTLDGYPEEWASANPGSYGLAQYERAGSSTRSETPVFLQVMNNQGERVLVGNPFNSSQRAGTNPQSSVHVTGNTATGSADDAGIAVADYRNVVIAHNIADNYAVPLPATNRVISDLVNLNVNWSPTWPPV